MLKNFLKSHPMHKSIVPYLDIIMISRLTLFFGVWVMICIGMYIGSIINNNVYINATDINFLTCILFLGISLVCGSVFITNQLYDIDKENGKASIIGNHVSIDKAIKINRALWIIGFLIIALVDYIVLLPIILIFIVCGKLYTSEKLSIKDNQWMNFLFYLNFGYLLMLSGIFYNRYDSKILDLIIESTPYMIPFLLSYGAVILVINILDLKSDKASRRRTFALSLGVGVVSISSGFLCLSSFLIGLYLNEPLASVSSISAIPFFLFLIIRGQEKDVIRSIRYPILLLNFYILMIYPLLLYPIIVTFYISKYYYWHRFSIHYPTLLVEND